MGLNQEQLQFPWVEIESFFLKNKSKKLLVFLPRKISQTEQSKDW